MRPLVCALSVWMLVGCRNQSTTFTNPFLAPDRVPPPATRPLTPGTAQPYYPGDPVQGVPTYAPPATSFPPATTYPPPATTYTPPAIAPPATGYNPAPLTPNTPSSPPGGWNTYPQPSPAPGYSPGSSSRAPGYGVRPTSAVNIPGDDNQLRFAQAFTPPPESPWVQPTEQPSRPLHPPSPRLPIQSIPPTQYANQPTPGYAPNAVFNEYGATPQQLRIRELTPAELQYSPGPTQSERAITSPAADAFRPQGSSRQRPADSPFSRPTISHRTPQRKDASSESRYGFGPRYEWLRGRLEYSQAAGQWKLRYIPLQADVASPGNSDQFGGSVLIENPHLLGDLRPGDFVRVRGQLHARETDARSFAPIYTVSIVQRQQTRM